MSISYNVESNNLKFKHKSLPKHKQKVVPETNGVYRNNCKVLAVCVKLTQFSSLSFSALRACTNMEVLNWNMRYDFWISVSWA